ncbi:MAG: glycosyltransferase family 4 protein [Verrucomicrobiota bacterium]|nr:glycosyltransferase family 4 protein [Verrucomicrobiota bacterium]
MIHDKQLTVAKIIKTDLISFESLFVQPFVAIGGLVNKIIIFLESSGKDKIDKISGTKVYYSPIKSRKDLKKQAQWVAEILKKENVDIIHCEQHSPTVIGVKAKKIAGTKYLFTNVHGNNMARGFSRQLFYRLNKKHITKVIACSEFVKQNVLETFPGYTKDKIITLPNGIDLEKFNATSVSKDQVLKLKDNLGLKSNEKMFLSTCRLSPDKNLNLLFNAFAKVCKNNDKIKLFIAGKGRLEKELKDLIISLDMKKKITLLGFRTDIKELLSACDCFILPSRREGFCLSAVEAAALGKPVIFTDTGIGRELLLDIAPDFLLPPNEEKAIEFALLKFLSLTKVEINDFSRNISRKVENRYSYEKLTLKTEKLYINTKKNIP